MPEIRSTALPRATAINEIMRGVYTWMFTGLAVTAVVAFAVASSETALQIIFGNKLFFYVLLFAPLGLVFYISARITKLAPSTAAGLFLLYSALLGTTLSSIFLYYTSASIFKAFLTASAMFGAMSLYGYTTKKSLASWGGFLIMGVFGLIIASVINLFLASPMMDFVISFIGVGIFTLLTAYDTQKIKQMSLTLGQQGELAAKRVQIYGALNLYIDFINIFLFLLRFMGSGRD